MSPEQSPSSASGAIPPILAELLNRIEKIQPAMAKVLLEEVKAESAHRREMEVQRLKSESASQLRGQVFGLIACLASLGTACYAAYLGAEWIGSIVGGSTILGIVSMFVLGKSYESKSGGK
jgi:hypothetical protein